MLKQLDLPYNEGIKDVEYKLDQLINLGDDPTGLKKIIKVLVWVGFLLAVLLIIMVVLLRKLKRIRGDDYQG